MNDLALYIQGYLALVVNYDILNLELEILIESS